MRPLDYESIKSWGPSLSLGPFAFSAFSLGLLVPRSFGLLVFWFLTPKRKKSSTPKDAALVLIVKSANYLRPFASVGFHSAPSLTLPDTTFVAAAVLIENQLWSPDTEQPVTTLLVNVKV